MSTIIIPHPETNIAQLENLSDFNKKVCHKKSDFLKNRLILTRWINAWIQTFRQLRLPKINAVKGKSCLVGFAFIKWSTKLWATIETSKVLLGARNVSIFNLQNKSFENIYFDPISSSFYIGSFCSSISIEFNVFPSRNKNASKYRNNTLNFFIIVVKKFSCGNIKHLCIK